VKIRNNQHAALQYTTDWTGIGAFNFDAELDETGMLNLIRSNCLDEFLLHFPEVNSDSTSSITKKKKWKQEAEKLLSQYKHFCDAIQQIFESLITQTNEKKQFATASKEYSFYKVLFNLW